MSTEDISYTIKFLKLPLNFQFDSILIDFVKLEKLNPTDIELIKSTNDSEIDFNYLKFFDSELNFKKFLNYLSALDDFEEFKLEFIYNDAELNSQLPGHLFVKGLLITTTAQDLYNIFKAYGEIKSCKIIFNDYGVSKGFGFLNFKNKLQAENAIKNLNGCTVDGNQLFINYHVSKKDRLKNLELKLNKYSNICIKNLPIDVERSVILELFGKFGEINSIFLPVDFNNEKVVNENYGFINYKYHNDAMKAKLEMNGYEIRPGYKIQIDRAERKKERIQYENLSNHFNQLNDKASDNSNADNNDIEHRDAEPPNFRSENDFYSSSPNRSFSFSSTSSTKSRTFTSPQIPSFTVLNDSWNQSSLISNQRLQYPQIYQPIIPFAYNHKTKSQELLLQQQPNNEYIRNPYVEQGNNMPNTDPNIVNKVNNNISKSFQQTNTSLLNTSFTTPQPPPNAPLLSSALPPFIITPDSNIISTTTGLPIAGPSYQDSNLHIKNIPLQFSDTDLMGLFQNFGPISSAKIITFQKDEIEKGHVGGGSLKLGDSKGFGFVCFINPVDASRALVAMDGFRIDQDHILEVSFAQRRENKFTSGKLHRYKQNHLNNLYQYVNNCNYTYQQQYQQNFQRHYQQNYQPNYQQNYQFEPSSDYSYDFAAKLPMGQQHAPCRWNSQMNSRVYSEGQIKQMPHSSYDVRNLDYGMNSLVIGISDEEDDDIDDENVTEKENEENLEVVAQEGILRGTEVTCNNDGEDTNDNYNGDFDTNNNIHNNDSIYNNDHNSNNNHNSNNGDDNNVIGDALARSHHHDSNTRYTDHIPSQNRDEYENSNKFNHDGKRGAGKYRRNHHQKGKAHKRYPQHNRSHSMNV